MCSSDLHAFAQRQQHDIAHEVTGRGDRIFAPALLVRLHANEVTDGASFTNDLGADSLDTVELIMEFEKQFGISIPDDQAETIQTVGDAVSYIESNAK